jgi:hypothetical protein
VWKYAFNSGFWCIEFQLEGSLQMVHSYLREREREREIN